jgi:DNA-directed RNA polymerase subunit H (RpoH/RPB5)
MGFRNLYDAIKGDVVRIFRQQSISDVGEFRPYTPPCCQCEHFEELRSILEERIFEKVMEEIHKKRAALPDTRIEEIINEEIRKIRV